MTEENLRRPRLSLAMPFYDEEENVERVIHELEQAFSDEKLEDYQIVAVDNGSRDRTAGLLKSLREQNPRVKIVTVPVNRGLGYGILRGFAEAEGAYVGFNCGDGQVSARDVVRVWRRLVEEDLDLCKVKRVVRHDGWDRLVISLGFNLLSRLLFGVRSTDINGIPKILKREKLNELQLFSRDWFIDTELMIKATQRHFKMGEVPVEFLKREGGGSHVGLQAILEFLKNLFVYRIKGWPQATEDTLLAAEKHAKAPVL